MRVARLAQAHGSALGVMLAIVPAALLACALAGYFAAGIAPLLDSEARRWVVVGALALAGAEVLVLRAAAAPREPTHSVGATMLVLWAALLSGASGLLVLALGVATAAPWLAGAGGALGTAAALALAATLGPDWENAPLAWIRRAGGSVLLLAALATGFSIV